MERKISLQKNYALTDVTLALISKHLNGKSISILIWLNIGIKFRNREEPNFKIAWSLIEKQSGTPKSNVAREVRNLIAKGVLTKLSKGVYIWNKEGITTLINTEKTTAKRIVKQTIEPQQKVIIIPTQGPVNDLGLMVDDNGNIIY